MDGAVEATLLAELEAAASRVVLHQRATVWGIFEKRTLAVWEGDRTESVRPEAMVLAPGAHSRAVPVPGWALPGVTNAETIRSLLEARALPPNQRVLVAGAGPLFPVVASRLVRTGARVVAVLDAAPSCGSREYCLQRMTRAGMGECQGRMCSPALAHMIAHRRGLPLDAIAPPSIRPPVTPVPIHVLATLSDE